VADDALTQVAEGGAPDVAKPLTGVGGGVWELAIRSRLTLPDSERIAIHPQGN